MTSLPSNSRQTTPTDMLLTPASNLARGVWSDGTSVDNSGGGGMKPEETSTVMIM